MKNRILALAAAALCLPGAALAASTSATPAAAPVQTEPAFHLDVNEAIGQIGSGMDQALTKLGALAVEYGTKAIELAAAVVQAQSIGALAVGFVWLIVSVIAFNWARKPIPADLSWCDPSIENLGVVGRAVGGTAAFLWGIFHAAEPLLNIWNWIGAIAPKLLLARMIFDKVVG